MQRLGVSGAVRPLEASLGVKGLTGQFFSSTVMLLSGAVRLSALISLCGSANCWFSISVVI